MGRPTTRHPQIYATPALRESMFPFNYTHAGFDYTQFDELADELSSAKRIAGRVGDGYVALFAASNSVQASTFFSVLNVSKKSGQEQAQKKPE